MFWSVLDVSGASGVPRATGRRLASLNAGALRGTMGGEWWEGGGSCGGPQCSSLEARDQSTSGRSRPPKRAGHAQNTPKHAQL